MMLDAKEHTCLPPSLPSVLCMIAVNRSVVGSGPIRCPGKSCLKGVSVRMKVRVKVSKQAVKKKFKK